MNLSKRNGKTYDIVQQLKYFRSDHVIQWMKIHARLPYSGWDYLFACSDPRWEDFREWFHLEFRHLVIAVNALEAIVKLRNNLDFQYETDETSKIIDLPHRNEVIHTCITRN